MAIKLADTLAPMSEFPAAMAEHIGFSDGATLQEKFDNKELGGGDSSVTLTQEEYEALSEEQKLDGLYYTYNTKRIYKNGVQYGASEPIPLTMEEYKALKEAGAIDEQQEYLIEANEQGILLSAEDIGYNNAESGIQATTVQGAIDKVVETVEDNYAKKTDIPTSLPANGGNADTVNNHTVKSDVPENAVFTDTVYDDTEIKNSITEINSNLINRKGSTENVNPISDLNNFYTGIGLFNEKTSNMPATTPGFWLILSGGGIGATVQVAFNLGNFSIPKTRCCASNIWSDWTDIRLS